MFKYSLLAAFIAVVSTFIPILYFKYFGSTEALIGAGIAALILVEVWGRRKKRFPTPKEKTSFLLSYFLIMVIFICTPALLAGRYTIPGLLLMFILSFVYPIWMAILFNERSLKRFVIVENESENN